MDTHKPAEYQPRPVDAGRLSAGGARAAAAVGVGAFLVALLVYTLCAAWVPFYNKSEPREALVVRALMTGKNLVLPRREAGTVPSKPPLFHWLGASALAAGVGPQELAIRLPSVVLGAASVGLAAALTTHWYGAAAGVLCAAVLGSGFEWLRAAVQARVDMTLTFFVLAATLAWYGVLRGRAGVWTVRAGYLCVAAAVLTKGPVGLVLPVLVVVMASLAVGAPRVLGRLVDTAGVGTMLAICASWYGLAWWSGGEAFIARQVLHENLNRFLGGSGDGSHAQPFYYYAVALLGSFFPWTLALPGLLWRACRVRAPSDRFLLAWIASVFVFYSLASGKRSAYLLPLLPPLAMLAGPYLVQVFSGRRGFWLRGLLNAMAAIAIVAALSMATGLEHWIIDRVLPHLRVEDREGVDAVVGILSGHRAGLAVTLTLIAVCLVALRLRVEGQGPWGAVAALCGIALAWCGGLTAYGTYPMAQALTLRPFAERVRAMTTDDDLIWVGGDVRYSFRYYVGRRLRPRKKRKGPSPHREFLVAPAPPAGAPPQPGRVPRLTDTRRSGGVVLELSELRKQPE